MGFFDFVEQHHLIGPAADRFGQHAALVVADIAGRRSDQPRDRMLLHEFRHIEADHRLIVVEEKPSERLGQFCLTNTGRSQEQERADGPVRILQPRAGPANGVGDGDDRLLLADDAFAQAVFHGEQLLALALQHRVDRDAGPPRDDRSDVLIAHFFIDHPFGFRVRPATANEFGLEIGDDAVEQFTGLCQVARPLRLLGLDAGRVELLGQTLAVLQAFFLRFPTFGQRPGFRL